MYRLSMTALAVFGLILATLPAPGAEDAKVEEGFTLLFNGKNFDGWKTKSGESLEGMKEAYKGRYKASDGKMVIDPKVKGDVTINTAKELAKDVHIKFDYLPGAECNNDLFFRGLKFDIKKGDVKNIKFDEWNTFEIIVSGKKAEFKNNGETQKTMDTKNESSVFGIRAEFGPIEIKNLRVKVAK